MKLSLPGLRNVDLDKYRPKLPSFRKSSSNSHVLESAEYYFGYGVSVTGSLTTEADVMIDGRFDGEISTSGVIEIGKGATCKANASARVLIVEGRFQGKADIDEAIRAYGSASIKADLTGQLLEVQPGAQLIGRLKISPDAKVG